MRVLLLAILLTLSACGSSTSVPIGTGGDMDELRKSPCACGEAIPARTQWLG